ncbi:hypothetical protein ACI65L_004436 [Pectobacterium carotovorum]
MKKNFDDEELKEAIGLNQANSINISRLLAQIATALKPLHNCRRKLANQPRGFCTER